MPRQPKPPAEQHETVRQQYDQVQSDGRYEEGMARMALYHRHCQDPVIFRTLGDIRGKSLLDLACGDGFYTRRFRTECGASPVMGIDLSPKQIERAEAIERREQLGIGTASATSCRSIWSSKMTSSPPFICCITSRMDANRVGVESYPRDAPRWRPVCHDDRQL